MEIINPSLSNKKNLNFGMVQFGSKNVKKLLIKNPYHIPI